MITDEDIRMFRAESRATGDVERTRCANAALGLPTGDGALGLLDRETCRLRIEAIIIREHTPGTSAQRLTADTITDEQIRELRSDVARTDPDDCTVGAYAQTALGRSELRAVARARCAEILNARSKPAERPVSPNPISGGSL